MIKYKTSITWSELPLINTKTSFDTKNEVYLTITDTSYYTSILDKKYLCNTGSCDFRENDKNLFYTVHWHSMLQIYEHNKQSYVIVRGRRIYIDSILKNLPTITQR